VPVVGGVVLMSVEKKSDEEEKDKNWWEKWIFVAGSGVSNPVGAADHPVHQAKVPNRRPKSLHIRTNPHYQLLTSGF
jgi:hypothetical protein